MTLMTTTQISSYNITYKDLYSSFVFPSILFFHSFLISSLFIRFLYIFPSLHLINSPTIVVYASTSVFFFFFSFFLFHHIFFYPSFIFKFCHHNAPSCVYIIKIAILHIHLFQDQVNFTHTHTPNKIKNVIFSYKQTEENPLLNDFDAHVVISPSPPKSNVAAFEFLCCLFTFISTFCNFVFI